jgi:hypothetical protein
MKPTLPNLWVVGKPISHKPTFVLSVLLARSGAALRAVPSSGWREIDDPLAELDNLWHDRDEMHQIFDERAAVEAAARTYEARRRGQRKGGNPAAAKAKIKLGRQIVATAKVEGVTAVYSDDVDVIAYALKAGLEGYRLADLPEPPQDPRHALSPESSDEL